MDKPLQQVNNERNFGFIMKFLLSAIFCTVLTYVTLSVFHLYDGITAVFLLSVLFTIVFSILLKTRRMMILTSAATGAVGLAVYMFYVFSPSFEVAASGYFDWIYQNIIGNVIIDIDYSSLTVILASFFIAALCHILFIKVRSFFMAFILTTLILLFIGVNKPNMPTAAIYVIAFFSIILGFLSVYNNLRKKKTQTNTESSFYLLFVIIIGMITLMITSLLPKDENPLEIKWMDEISNYLYYSTTVINKSNDNLFYFAYHIKSDNLDGMAYPDTLKVLSVDMAKPEYLKYSVKDKYTGFSWIDTNRERLPISDTKNEMSMTSYERINGINFLEPGETGLTDFTFDNIITVTFDRIISNFLFTPVHTESIQSVIPDLSVRANGIIFMKNRQKKNFTYILDSRCIDYDSNVLKDLLRKSKVGLYNDSRINIQESVREQLKQRADKVASVYLQIPEILTARVKNLAKDLTQASGTDYDKVKIIENYIAENMNYTLSPPKRSARLDLVDFFLFESKQGYCTSYASAMVMMVRSIGIPARYCEGYVMPEQDPAQTTYIVTNNQAHAWCEVYFEGFGWVPFEPTKTLQSSFYRNTALDPEDLPEPTPEEEPGEVSGEISGNESQNGSSVSEVEVISDAVSSPDENEPGEKASSILILIIISLSGLLIIALIIKCYLNDKRVKKMLMKAQFGIPRDGIITLYKYYLGALGVLNLKRADSETAFEFFERIKKESPSLAGFRKVTDAFVEARYNPSGRLAVLQKDVYLYNSEFQTFLHDHLNKLEYYYYHYYIGIV